MIRPTNQDAVDYWYETRGNDAFGGVSANDRDEQWMTDEEVETVQRERREALARKRPVGFAPWPDELP